MNVFLSRLYLKDSFAAYKIPGWRFSFSTLNVLSSAVFYEKSSINTIFFYLSFLFFWISYYIYAAVVDVPQISKPLFIFLQGFFNLCSLDQRIPFVLPPGSSHIYY